jgi:hypothetical protein
MSVRVGGRGGVGRCGDASGREVGPGQNPGGETKPTEGEGGHRLATVGGRYGPISGARPRGRGSSSQPPSSDGGQRGGTTARGQGPAETSDQSSGVFNGTAASCRWGDFFEGCEVRREEASDPPQARRAQVHSGAARQAGAGDCKRGEPLPVAGCNKPATPVRRKPSRWCETTRAERDRRTGTPLTEGGGDATGSRRTGGPASSRRSGPRGLVDARNARRLGETRVGRRRGNELTQLERIPREAGAESAGNC